MNDSFLSAAVTAGRDALTEIEGKALLAQCGIDVPRSRFVARAEDAASAVAGLAGPFVVKVVSRDILHKSDAGGVTVGLADDAAVADAIRVMARKPAVAAAMVDGYLVEEMAPAGLEVVVGAIRDPQFGPMVMVGLGGVFVEVLGDVSFRLCPIDRAEAAAMLDDLEGAALLDGARGSDAVSGDAIADALLAIGGNDGLMLREDGIAEIDVNPMIATAGGVVAVDARVILRRTVDTAEAPVKRPRDELPALERFRPLFRPRTVAVVGASATKPTIGNTFIRRMQAFGYPGAIYPIHPAATHIEALPAYPSLGRTPEPVDYAYVAIGAERVPDLLAGARHVAAFDHNVRSASGKESGRRIEGGQHVQPPAHLVHGDYTLTSGPQRLRDLAKPPSTNDTYRTLLADGATLLDGTSVAHALDGGRFAIINLWRNIAPEPVATHPLALCDATSVRPDDLVVFEIHYADRIGENYFAKHADQHRWYFYPAMTGEEALLIKQWDSAGGLARSGGAKADAMCPDSPCTFSFHSAFEDPTTAPDVPDRWSIEVRCVALYE